MKRIRLLLITFILLFCPLIVKADNKVTLHLFYGETCPHCKSEEAFLDEYLKEEKDVALKKYEVWNNKSNQDLLIKVQNTIKNYDSGVPYLVIGNTVILGYLDGVTDVTIRDTVNEFKKDSTYIDVVTKVANNEEVNVSTMTGTEEEVDENFNIPVLGKVNARKVSLPILSLVLGLVDGFNPCAMWVLLFLITMLLSMKDRKKMWILGFTFIITSGLVYLAFMLTWLNLATFISKLLFVRLLVALISFVVGFINLNNYFKARKKDDGCEVVDKKDRKKIMNKIMSITKEKKFIIAIFSMVVLAASVNIIEMMCSVGLPLIFTQILSMNNLSIGFYVLYMFIYILCFLIDDIIVFVVAMTTLKVSGISTKYSKYSHLVAGVITILIGMLLLIKPSILMFNF